MLCEKRADCLQATINYLYYKFSYNVMAPRSRPSKKKTPSKPWQFKGPLYWQGHKPTLRERIAHPNAELHKLVAKAEEADALLEAAKIKRKLLKARRKKSKRKK